MPSQLSANGGTCEVELPLICGKNELTCADIPPNQKNTLQLQVAVKCQLDIFYFTQPFDATAVLDNSSNNWVDKQLFMSQWQSLETKAAQRVYLFGANAGTRDYEQVNFLIEKLESVALYHVATNTANKSSYYYGRYSKGGNEFHYALLEFTTQKDMIRLNARATQSGMAPVLHTTCVNLLGIKPKQ